MANSRNFHLDRRAVRALQQRGTSNEFVMLEMWSHGTMGDGMMNGIRIVVQSILTLSVYEMPWWQ